MDKENSDERFVHDEEGLQPEWDGGSASYGGMQEGRKLLLYIGGGFLLVVILAVLLLRSGDGERSSLQDSGLEAVTGEISQVRSRLQNLEGLAQEWADRLNALERSQAEVKGSLQELHAKLDKVHQDVISTTRTKPPAQATARTTGKTLPAGRYHTVQKGDTLYSIGKRYNMSLTELTRLNNLSAAKKIYVGQKVLISPAGKE
ncbi:LysM peptidoglycan-binding domain-containing protein [Thermodesulfobacteriota bacterium]